MMSATITRGCPRPGCEGEIEFFEETGEDYTAHGLSVWSYSYLLMADPGACSEGHQFDREERERIERDATDDRANDDSWMEP